MTDIQNWQDLKSGKQSAFQSIYSDHIGYLIRYGYKITKDESLIEDCAHDLFVELWNKRDSIGDTDNIRAYLTVAFRRKIVKSLQRLQKTSSEKEPEEIHFHAELAIDEVIIQSERSREWVTKLQEAMNKLSVRQREVLHMKFYSQMNNEEISEALGINNQSVRNLVHRSLEQLKKLFFWMILIIIF